MYLFVAGNKIEMYLDGSMVSNMEKIASANIKALLIKVLAPVLKSIRNPPDNLEEYKQEYGYMGPSLHSAVIKARTQPTPTSTSFTNVNNPITCTSTIARAVSTPSGIIQQVFLFFLLFTRMVENKLDNHCIFIKISIYILNVFN